MARKLTAREALADAIGVIADRHNGEVYTTSREFMRGVIRALKHRGFRVVPVPRKPSRKGRKA